MLTINKKTIAFIIIGIIIISGMVLLIGNNTHNTNKNLTSKVYLTESGFTKKINNQNVKILELKFNNITIFMYDNNQTIIQNFTISNNVIPLFTISTDTTEPYNFATVFNAINNINFDNININGISGNLFLFKSILYPYQNPSYTYTIFMDLSGQTQITISSSNSTLWNTLSLEIFSNYLYYQNNGNIEFLAINNNFQLSNNYFGDILTSNNLSLNTPITDIYINYFNDKNYFHANFINTLDNGNLTLLNTSGYDNTYYIGNLQNISLILGKGNYTYSFLTNVNSNNTYFNGTFNLNGNITVYIGNNVITDKTVFLIKNISYYIITLFAIVLSYMVFKSYYMIIPEIFIFSFLGYILQIYMFSILIISFIILAISLLISTNIMKKIGD